MIYVKVCNFVIVWGSLRKFGFILGIVIYMYNNVIVNILNMLSIIFVLNVVKGNWDVCFEFLLFIFWLGGSSFFLVVLGFFIMFVGMVVFFIVMSVVRGKGLIVFGFILL